MDYDEYYLNQKDAEAENKMTEEEFYNVIDAEFQNCDLEFIEDNETGTVKVKFYFTENKKQENVMDKNETEEHLEESLLHAQQELEHQEQSELEQSVNKICNSVTKQIEEIDFLLCYMKEQKMLHTYNHRACLLRALRTVELKKMRKKNDI